MVMLVLVVLLFLVRLGAIGRDVTFFSTIVASFAIGISPWPEHLSFRVKIVTLLLILVSSHNQLGKLRKKHLNHQDRLGDANH